jgi:hypothetical protein
MKLFCFRALLFLTASLLLTGCASTSTPRGAYPTLKQIRMNVEPKMTRYRNEAAFGGLSLGERQRVEAAYSRYEKAYQEAVKAAGANYDVTTPDNVKALANEVISAIDALTF